MKPRVEGLIEFTLRSNEEARAIYQALLVEAANPPSEERGTATVELSDNTVRIRFEARDPSSARALINAFLSLAAATIEALRRLEGESRRGNQ